MRPLGNDGGVGAGTSRTFLARGVVASLPSCWMDDASVTAHPTTCPCERRGRGLQEPITLARPLRCSTSAVVWVDQERRCGW